MEFSKVKIEIYVPENYVQKILAGLNQAQACRVGNYDHVASITQVSGYWRPLAGASPFQGEVGKICSGTECKMEVLCAREFAAEAIRCIREIHPYEEPIINILPLLEESMIKQE